MRNAVKKLWLAMIIGMAVICPVQAQLWGSGELRLPDPVAFANEMEMGNVSKATAWLDAGLAPGFLGSRIGSGLMIGAWEGKIDLMRLFISRGADINQANANGETALTLAAWRGNLDAAKWLIERGARINAPPRQWSPLHYAVFAGHSEMADYLMGLGADIDALTTNGSSVLMMAVYEGREALARKLIEQGARRDVKNEWGDGALEWAMRNNNLGIARMVSNPEEFNIAVSQPKEKWGESKRSLSMSKELESLLSMRETLVDRKLATDAIDHRIAAERVRLVRAQVEHSGPQRASTLEVTASRDKSQGQSIRVIRQPKPTTGFKVPPATFHGKPKMPVPAAVRSY